MGLFARLFGFRPRTTRRPRRTILSLEQLETRTVPYAVTGNAWPHPQMVTISFEPDGTDLGGKSSNLFATFDADFGSAAAWENVILKAAQSWAQYTNLNFTVVPDNGAPSGSGSYEQGNTGFGDIRIGGFNFGNSSDLALGYMPPPVNNYSVAGDISFNTGQAFNINGLDYDLYTVAVHEFGHALGLDHSSSTSAVMYADYQGVQSGLYADDIAGIRAIYGAARPLDSFAAAASNTTFATASNITSSINASTLTASLAGLDITTTSDVEYFEFTAPTGGNGQMTVTVQSTGLSLLEPSLKIYNASETQLATKTGSGDLGSTLTDTVAITAGQTYYVRVAGGATTAFGTGDYGLALNFDGSTNAVIASPNTETPNGNPLNGGGGIANRTDSNGLSVDLLLSPAFNSVDGTLTGVGLGGVAGLTGGVGGALNQIVNTAVDLPFADLMSLPGNPPADATPGSSPAKLLRATGLPDLGIFILGEGLPLIVAAPPNPSGLGTFVASDVPPVVSSVTVPSVIVSPAIGAGSSEAPAPDSSDILIPPGDDQPTLPSEKSSESDS